MREIIQENSGSHKIGYVVVGKDESIKGFTDSDVSDNIHPISSFKFDEFPEHTALEQAISLANTEGMFVYTLLPDGEAGEQVWPDHNDINETSHTKNNRPFAVFAIGKFEDGYAATTRPTNSKGSEKIGLPGGKLDDGETALEALLRECNEEGWQVDITNSKLVHTNNVNGKLIQWYTVRVIKQLKNFKEKGRIFPIVCSKEQVLRSGFGNAKLPLQETVSDESVMIVKGADYSTINGIAYRLKECGCDTTMGYNKGNHTLMVRRDLLSLAVDALKNTCDNVGQTLGDKLEEKYFKKMNKAHLKKIVKEEYVRYKEKARRISEILNEESPQKPVLDPEKSTGIILGAVKTLFNSNAIVGVDPSKTTEIANDILKHMPVILAPYGAQPVPTTDDLNDDSAYDKEEETLDDQSQYDPDLSKQTTDKKEPVKPKQNSNDSLFEVKRIANRLKL